ncbi:hypothetical protein NE237_027578 [Protea cynaroides]|uniref:Uncharacterized protein n=1 Tax=Protea cynaroides TaxID=273540 RepID=A0A9Q0JT53_9MAGN|nr:hypothetical protein NE237_027578 [Protea cynaroides]
MSAELQTIKDQAIVDKQRGEDTTVGRAHLEDELGTLKKFMKIKVSILEKVNEAIKEFKASEDLKTFVTKSNALKDFRYELVGPTFFKGIHFLSEYVRHVVGEDFDFSKFQYDVDLPCNPDEAKDSLVEQLESGFDQQMGVIDQKVDEALKKLEDETAIAKATAEASIEEAVATGGADQSSSG